MELDSLTRLTGELHSQRWRPVYLLMGDEEYQIKHALTLFRDKVLPKEVFEFNFEELRAGETSILEVLQFARTIPMTASHRLIFFHDLEILGAEDMETLVGYVRSPNPRTLLVLISSGLDRRTNAFKELREHTCFLEFPKLKGAALERWATEFFRRRAIQISSLGLRKILDLSGSDLQSLSNELEKLSLYAGHEKEIPDEAITELVLGSRQHGIFELTNALARRDRAGALLLLANLFEAGESPQYLTTMIAWQFRRMLIAKELLAGGKSASEISSLLQVRFALEEFIQQVRTIQFDAAMRLYLRLAEADNRMKSTSLNQHMLLENLICAL
jgi:DNA polymerase-3 subunit delta